MEQEEQNTTLAVEDPDFWKEFNYRELASALGYTFNLAFMKAVHSFFKEFEITQDFTKSELAEEYESPNQVLVAMFSLFLFSRESEFDLVYKRKRRGLEPVSKNDQARHDRIKRKIKKKVRQKVAKAWENPEILPA